MYPLEHYEIALQKEFDLAYHSSLGPVSSWQNLPVFERDWHYGKLREQKELEKKRQEEEQAKIRAAQASRRSRR